jgi:hypothetical protein
MGETEMAKNFRRVADDRPARKRYGKVKWIVGGGIALAIIGAAGGHSATPTVAAVSPAPTRTVTAAPAPTTTVTVAPVVHYMPDVTGMNLQAAQDKIHDAGVFYSKSWDATGAQRHQVLDSDWTVVAQTPAAGTAFGEGDATLAVVKVGE